jgi:DNA-binding PadR family transcriptional regulator
MYDRRRGGPRGRGRGPAGAWRQMESFEGGWGGGGRRRVRRGDVRRAVLLALTDGPANGYEVMSRLEARSGGIWRPSPGSVYPTLQMLEDEGLVRSETTDDTRTYQLTEAGQAQASAGAEDPSGRAPWDSVAGGDERVLTFRDSMIQTMAAAKQVAQTGQSEQLDRGIEIVRRARKELYQLLAED